MSLKVIGAGFGRTGTMSTQKALEQLGFDPCYHMTEVLKQGIPHIDVWEAAERGDPVDWHTFFDAYGAAVDMPVSLYYEPLMEAFPDAKIVLTTRDPARWYDSFHGSIWALHHAKKPAWMLWLRPSMKRFFAWTNRSMWQDLFDGKFLDKSHAIAVFNQHNERVVATVPADKLLIFSVKDGWDPLCQFLDVPIPDTPFPHANDRKQMQRLVKTFRLLNILTPIVIIGLIALLVWGAAAWII